jgi:hypothetical protein
LATLFVAEAEPMTASSAAALASAVVAVRTVLLSKVLVAMMISCVLSGTGAVAPVLGEEHQC